MKNSFLRRSVSLLLSIFICLSTIVGVALTASAASTTGKAIVIGYPRNGDANYSTVTWGHDELHYMGGWMCHKGRYTTFYTMNSYKGNICYCIEPGRPLDRLLLESRTESPFDYTNHTRLYIPTGMPTPDNDNEDYFKAIADEIYRIIKATNGHTAILFTSYKTLNLVHDLLRDRLTAYDTICMTRSNKNAITDFKKSKNGILFASGSMWEGVDCVGDCLSSVIIVRLPFPMRSALMEEKKNNCDSVGDFVDRYCTPNMLIKLRQGVGRLIRCESDTGVVSILDPRAISKSYSGKIGQALHKFPKVDSAQEIESFMRGVKDEEYYGEKKENRK